MQNVIARKRGKGGKLIRGGSDLPSWVHVDANGMRVIPRGKRSSFSKMFQQVKQNRGLSKEKIKQDWDNWRQANPKFGKGGPL